MKVLKGKLFPSGNIEFSFVENEWAYRWYESNAAKSGATGRIEFNPAKISIDISLSANLDDEEFGWLDHIKTILDASDKVYLRVVDKCFRFQRAVHQISKTREIMVLGSQADINSYAQKHWSTVNYFFVDRFEGYVFEIKKMVTQRAGSETTTKPMDLSVKVGTDESEQTSQLSFIGTGSGAPVEIVDWRKSVPEGGSGRFSNDKIHVRLKVFQARQPLVFLHEIREEFKNQSYEFKGDALNRELKKMLKK